VTGEIWSQALDELAKIWAQKYPGVILTLLTDNLATHRDMEVVEEMWKNLIHMFYLPPNTSHFLQPLDDLPFAIYKTELRNLADKLIRSFASLGKSKVDSVFLATLVSGEAEKIAFAPDKVRAGFKNTGVWPWNPELILNNVLVNAGRAHETKAEEKDPLSDLKTMARNVYAADLAARKELADSFEVKHERVSVTTQYLTKYDSDSLRIAHKQRIADEERIADEKVVIQEEKKRKREQLEVEKRKREEEREVKRKFSCRIKGCRKKWNDNNINHWTQCNNCLRFALCPTHAADASALQVLVDHKAECALDEPPKKRARQGEAE